MSVATGLRRVARRLKAVPLVRRYYHPVLVRGVAFVGRRPWLHRAVRAGYRLAPGLQAYLRRFRPDPPPSVADLSRLEARLGLVPATAVAAGGMVTLEELAFIARTL